MSYKTKKRWKGIVAAVLVIVVLIAACAGLAAISKNDTKKIRASAFSRGDLDENGIYVESDQSIYTKEAFGCIGLRVEPDFESKVTYDVYYYDYDERLIEVRKGFSGVYDEDYPLAQYARIVIHPDIPADVSEKDFKINFWEESKYAKKLTITVDKEQEYLYEGCVNLYDDKKATYNATLKNWSNGKFELLTEDDISEGVPSASIMGFKVSSRIDIGNYDYEYYDVFVRCLENDSKSAVTVVCSSDDDILGNVSFNFQDYKAGEWCKMTVELSEMEGADGLYIRMPSDCECYAFGYNK